MKALLAEFTSAQALTEVAQAARTEGFPLLDALTPYPMTDLDDLIGARSPGLRVPMAIAGFGTALFFFALQSWSAVIAYPFNEGGRPYFSWPVFILVPFEVGVLAAGLAGFGFFLYRCGLPRLHHPFFDVPGLERASQDRFFLVVDPLDADRSRRLKQILLGAGALSISESDT